MSRKKDKKNKDVVLKANKPNGDNKKNKDICHHCKKKDIGGWIVKANKLKKASTSSMFIIENYLTTLHCNYWVLDTECDFHICNCMCHNLFLGYSPNSSSFFPK